MTASLGPTLAQLCPNVVRRQFKASTPIACDARTHLIFVDGGWHAFGVPNKRPPDTSLIIIRPTPPHHFTFPIALRSPARLPKRAMLDPGQHPSAPGISQFPKPFIWHFVENREELLRGGAYVAYRTTDERRQLREACLYIGKHPSNGVMKFLNKKGRPYLDLDPKPQGVLQVELGVPYYQALSYRPRDATLVALTHTRESL